jgi:hypothetical protein
MVQLTRPTPRHTPPYKISRTKLEQQEDMAKWEIKKRFGIFEALWWKFAQGPEIAVKWPTGMITAGPGPEDPLWFDLGGAAYITFESADPNDHYRPWLEQNVGQQGWDWNWKHHIVANDNEVLGDQVIIKFRKKHQDAALIAKMRWM